jgi:hypothetical protein
MIRRDFAPAIKAVGRPAAASTTYASPRDLHGPGGRADQGGDGPGWTQTVATTLGIYSHTLAGQDADAARKVEALLLGNDVNVARGGKNVY